MTDRTSNERSLLDESRKILRAIREDIFERGVVSGRSQRTGEDLIHRIDSLLAEPPPLDRKESVPDGAPIAYTVQASHDGSYCPPFLFRMDAANYQRQKSEMHPGVTWTIVPLYASPAIETGGRLFWHPECASCKAGHVPCEHGYHASCPECRAQKSEAPREPLPIRKDAQ